MAFSVTTQIWSSIAELSLSSLIIGTFVVLIGSTVAPAVYDAYFGPLSKFAGPKLRAMSSIPQAVSIFRGREHEDYVTLHKKYGKVVRVAPNELSFVGGATVWKDVLGFKKSGTSNFPKCPRFYGGQLLERPNSFLANADDAEHSKLRRVVSHAFADRSLHDVEHRLLHWARNFKRRLDGMQAGHDSIDMVKLYNCGTFDVMGDLAFNEDLGMLADGNESEWVTNIFKGIKQSSYVRGVKDLHDSLWYFIDNVVMKMPEARREVGKTLEFTNERLEKRLNNPPARPDLWSQIIAKGIGEQALDRAEHQGLAFFFMVAGTETTASALSAITFFLLCNPNYTKQLQEELRSTFSTFEDLSFSKLGRLKYLNAVIQEGLRMYPPVPIALPRRTPAEGAQVDGQYIPGNVVCSIPHYSTYRSPEHFAEPNEFRPERWLGDPKYTDDNLDAVEPFHVGPRNCVGKNLAWHEMRLFLATAYTFFDLTVTEDSRDWLAQNQVFTVWQKPPLWCRVNSASVV